jgi:hypothetical protein
MIRFSGDVQHAGVLKASSADAGWRRESWSLMDALVRKFPEFGNSTGRDGREKIIEKSKRNPE